MKLVTDLRSMWKLWSVRLAAITGILAAILASNQSIALGLVYFLPNGPLRIVAAFGIGVIVFVIPTITRLMRQKKLEKPNGD